MSNTNLPSDAAERKAIPVYSGFVRYFPDAMVAVAQCSKAGNDQHNPGKPLHWDRSKSGDELDALQRHLIDAGTIDSDGIRHSAKAAWRAMANLQKEIEDERVADNQCTDHAVPTEPVPELSERDALAALEDFIAEYNQEAPFDQGKSGVRLGPSVVVMGLPDDCTTDDWLYADRFGS